MNNHIAGALRRLVSEIATTPSVRAVGRSGGDRPLPAPGEGDIDLFIYCTEIPPAGQREAWFANAGPDLDQLQIGALSGGNWGIADSMRLCGVETWLMYFTIDQLWAEIRTTLGGQSLERVDNYFYPVGRLAMLQNMESLHDPDGLFPDVSAAIREYPAELAAAQLAHHLPRMHDEEDFTRAVARQDVLFYHFVLDLALDHFLQALFALNRTYFPSRKRSLEFVAGFRLKPADCEDRLLSAVELGGRPESISHSYHVWQELTRELSALAPGGNCATDTLNDALPPSEMAFLNSAIGQTCTRIELVGMTGCEEDYLEPHDRRGFHEVTWGLVLGLGDSSVAITWEEDEYGNPFRIAIVSGEQLRALPSAIVQDVSTLRPWQGLLDTALASAQVRTHSTNYGSESWYAVPWGIELLFGSGRRILVASARHGHFTSGGITADEIVLLWSTEQIENTCRVFESQAIEWQTSRSRVPRGR